MSLFTTQRPNMQSFQDDKESRRKQRLEEIRQYHAQLIRDLDIPSIDLNMKMAFYDKQGRKVVGIFPSEFKKEKGVFIEFVTKDYDIADPERKVYRVAPNPHFEQEYELSSSGSFLVPIEELRLVNPTSVAISKASAVISNDKLLKEQSQANPQSKAPVSQRYEDAPYTEMTIRDYITIHTGVAVSNKQWLNDLVTNKIK